MTNLHKLKKLLRYISMQKLQILLILIVTFVGMLCGLLQPKFLGQIIDFVGNRYFDRVMIVIVLMCLTELSSSLLTYLSTFLMAKVGIKVSTQLKTDFYNNMVMLPSPKFDNMQSGNLLTRYETDISNLSEFLSSHFVTFIMNFFSLIIILYFSFSNNVVLTIIVILFLPISLYVERIFSNKLKKNIRNLRIMNDEYLTLFNETIKGINDVKHLNAEGFFKSKMIKLQIVFMKLLIKLNLIRNFGGFLKRAIFILLEFVTLIAGVRYMRLGVLTIGSFIAFSNYAARLNNVISAVIRVYGYFNEVTVSIDRIEEINSKFNSDEEASYQYVECNMRKKPIKFDSVSFCYNDCSPVFENLCISFTAEHLNIVLGDSGLGKSTIFKLMLKLYEPQAGGIYFGNTNISKLSSSFLRHNIAYAPHNPYFFNVSIAENIRYANPQITNEEMLNILCEVNLSDFISTLPNGIDTVMQEAGGNFSEGQKQRLNIARAIAKKPQVFLFDEPTSALDKENRNDILQIIQQLSVNSTVIMITHDREVIDYFKSPNLIEIDKMIQRSS